MYLILYLFFNRTKHFQRFNQNLLSIMCRLNYKDGAKLNFDQLYKLIIVNRSYLVIKTHLRIRIIYYTTKLKQIEA